MFEAVFDLSLIERREKGGERGVRGDEGEGRKGELIGRVRKLY